MNIKALISLLFLFLLLFVVTPSFAQDEPISTKSGTRSERMLEKKNLLQNLREKFLSKREETKEKIEARREEGKMRSCEAREAAINKRSAQLFKMVDNMEVKFSSISARVQDYYTSKVVPSGKTLSNYDDLVSDIDAKKASADAALATAQADIDSFSCDSDDPKALFIKFRKDMQEVKDALKEYRTSIKNLIVAVKSLGTAEESE